MGYILPHLGMILLIFMMPSEVYCILDIIIDRSREIFREKQDEECHWHVCFDHHHYVEQVSMFFKIYLNTTFFKKRSVLAHCQSIHFDLTHLVDDCMRYFLCNFLSLPIIIDFALIFLNEGVVAFYREIISILRLHKNYLKGL